MMSFDEIELEARKLLTAMERDASRIWPNTQPARHFMCDPEAACRYLGFQIATWASTAGPRQLGCSTAITGRC